MNRKNGVTGQKNIRKLIKEEIWKLDKNCWTHAANILNTWGKQWVDGNVLKFHVYNIIILKVEKLKNKKNYIFSILYDGTNLYILEYKQKLPKHIDSFIGKNVLLVNWN